VLWFDRHEGASLCFCYTKTFSADAKKNLLFAPDGRKKILKSG
jgi:hypothetical protein